MNIVMAGHVSYPRGSAGASRLQHLARGLTELGHRVWVIAMSPQPAEVGGEPYWQEQDGVRYLSAVGKLPPGGNRTLAQKLNTQWRLLVRSQTVAQARMAELHQGEGIDVFLGYSGLHFGMQRVLRFCRTRHIPVVRDVVEWWIPSYFPWGRLNPVFWNLYGNMHVSLPRSDGIVAISRAIAAHFEPRGIPTLRIPAVIDPTRWPEMPPCNDRPPGSTFQLCYLGNSHLRDAPMLMVQAIHKTVAAGHDVFLHIVGSSAGQGYSRESSAWVDSQPLLRGHVKFWGRVTDADVRERLFSSDALLFPRISGVTANAAFPTRLPEYLMTGRPVIATKIGDIPEYLRDGKEAILVEPDSVESMSEGIVRLMSMPDRGRKIGEAGRQRCLECFDYRPYCRQLSSFFESLRPAQ